MKRSRNEANRMRHERVRRGLKGTAERPRLCIHKSLRHLYLQVIDDEAGRSICAATTNTKEAKAAGRKTFCTKAIAKQLGETLAQRAREKGVT